MKNSVIFAVHFNPCFGQDEMKNVPKGAEKFFGKALGFILCNLKIWRLEGCSRKIKLDVHVLRELGLFLFEQGYARYHRLRETVRFRAF